MKSYPVWFPPVQYRGANEKRRAKAATDNRLINRVSRYVNEVGIKSEEPFHRYLYYDIARALDEDADDVRRLCNVDGGGNGFIVVKPGLTMDGAFDEVAKGA